MFDPDWGIYDMACGSYSHSVYSGAADRAKHLEATGGFNHHPRNQKFNYCKDQEPVYELYRKVRRMREEPVDEAKLAKSILNDIDQIDSNNL